MPAKLKVLHVGPSPYCGRGSGIDAAAWPLLCAQVAAGVDVHLLTLTESHPAALAEAERVQVKLSACGSRRFEMMPPDAPRVVAAIRPDLVHFHSVFIPAHASLGRVLNLMKIPYVLSPHGGLNLWRGRLKKGVYSALVEKKYFRHAQAIFTLTEREKEKVTAWLGGGQAAPRISVVPNSIPALSPDAPLWQQPDTPRIVYLGRFDVFKKGLDRFVAFAKVLPEVQFTAYGSAQRSERKGFATLLRSGLPENFRFQDPVYGGAKMAVLNSASIYLQPSRDEGFGMSIVEAMSHGVPVAMTPGCDIADIVAGRDLGLVLSDDLPVAAAQLAAAIADPVRLSHWSRAGRQWTLEHLSPNRIADQMIAAYAAITSTPARSDNSAQEASSRTRSLARHLPRVGPMLPTGSPSW